MHSSNSPGANPAALAIGAVGIYHVVTQIRYDTHGGGMHSRQP